MFLASSISIGFQSTNEVSRCLDLGFEFPISNYPSHHPYFSRLLSLPVMFFWPPQTNRQTDRHTHTQTFFSLDPPYSRGDEEKTIRWSRDIEWKQMSEIEEDSLTRRTSDHWVDFDLNERNTLLLMKRITSNEQIDKTFLFDQQWICSIFTFSISFVQRFSSEGLTGFPEDSISSLHHIPMGNSFDRWRSLFLLRNENEGLMETNFLRLPGVFG